MKRFIHRENLRLLRDQLARTTDEEKWRQIVRLVEQEEFMGHTLADDPEQRRGSETLDNMRRATRPTHR